MVMVSWDNIPATTISRAYTGHRQISLAILDNDGGNDFLHNKGGLHFGIRKRYLFGRWNWSGLSSNRKRREDSGSDTTIGWVEI